MRNMLAPLMSPAPHAQHKLDLRKQGIAPKRSVSRVGTVSRISDKCLPLLHPSTTCPSAAPMPSSAARRLYRVVQEAVDLTNVMNFPGNHRQTDDGDSGLWRVSGCGAEGGDSWPTFH